MSKAIYDEIANQLSSGMKPDDLDKVRPSWQKLAFAIATGVVSHIKSNMEVSGIQVSGPITVAVSGTQGTGTANLNQSGTLTGHVN